MIPDDFEFKNEMDCRSRGVSIIITPLGTPLTDPLLDREGIVYADLKMDLIIKAKAFVDCAGHYARWDILSLNFNPRPYRAITNDLSSLSSNLREDLDELLSRSNQLTHEEIVDELHRLAGRK